MYNILKTTRLSVIYITPFFLLYIFAPIDAPTRQPNQIKIIRLKSSQTKKEKTSNQTLLTNQSNLLVIRKKCTPMTTQLMSPLPVPHLVAEAFIRACTTMMTRDHRRASGSRIAPGMAVFLILQWC